MVLGGFSFRRANKKLKGSNSYVLSLEEISANETTLDVLLYRKVGFIVHLLFIVHLCFLKPMMLLFFHLISFQEERLKY